MCQCEQKTELQTELSISRRRHCLLCVSINKKKDNELHVTVGTRKTRTDIVAKHLDEDTDTSGRPNITLWRSRRVKARAREFSRQCMSA